MKKKTSVKFVELKTNCFRCKTFKNILQVNPTSSIPNAIYRELGE